ncbi:MAG TPA: hypothetical protein VFU21_12800 [Kofleriaceae bacterium]|nr:hypothetical protein [Kofleriaceae bacterium]
MTACRVRIPFAILLACAWAGRAEAQSAPTCAFDPATAAVTVTVDGQAAELRAPVGTGEILLDGVSCGGATVLNTDSIQVNGGSLSDSVTLVGRFAPGLTPEASGGSEIEIAFALGESSGPWDGVTLTLTQRRDVLTFTSDGIDVGNDLDRDIFMAGVDGLVIDALGGNDRIDAAAYTGMPGGVAVTIWGGSGQDVLIGSSVLLNHLYGEEDGDVLRGGDGNDRIDGGPGDDVMFGRGGHDSFHSEGAMDGADDMRGGDGSDTVLYSFRPTAVTVTIGDDTQPDGEAGEGDTVRNDVENVRGGNGPNVLVGNAAANELYGGPTADELYGGGGNDLLVGSTGADMLFGDAGADQLLGHAGPDVLYGGDGADILQGDEGRDDFFGEGGNDRIRNEDGVAEKVNCGPGPADDAEPDPLDTFIGCEL